MDNYVTNKLLNNTNIFKDISPNIITLFGVLINIVIIYLLFYTDIKSKCIFYILAICMFLRWMIDNLDGCVARKYNKESDLGGLLDTLSDAMLFIIIGVFVNKSTNNKYFIPILIFYCVMFYINVFTYNYIFDHNKLKKYDNNILNNTYVFMINNTFIIYCIFIWIIYYVM
jgi:phosphatidylglycerophosphate synthase